MEELHTDHEIRAIVLTGAGRAFSAGVDLEAVVAEPTSAGTLVTYLGRCFEAVLRCPLPTVAAVNGHAIAGGCVLAASCDVRVGRHGDYRVGLTELTVGVPFPTSALEIMRARTGARLHEVILGARTHPPAEACALGLLDEMVPAGWLLQHALETADRLSQIPRSTYALTKTQLHHPVIDRIERLREDWDARAQVLWQTEPVRTALRTFMERTLR